MNYLISDILHLFIGSAAPSCEDVAQPEAIADKHLNDFYFTICKDEFTKGSVFNMKGDA